MAVPAKKLQAFAGGDNAASAAPAAPASGAAASDGADTSDGAGAPPESTRFLKVLPLLIEHAKDIEACCDELDPDVLSDPESPLEEDQSETFKESLEDLDGELLAAMKDAFKGGIDQQEAEALADHMADSDAIDDSAPVAGWLFRAAKELDTPGAQDATGEDDDESGSSGADDDEPPSSS